MSPQPNIGAKRSHPEGFLTTDTDQAQAAKRPRSGGPPMPTPPRASKRSRRARPRHWWDKGPVSFPDPFVSMVIHYPPVPLVGAQPTSAPPPAPPLPPPPPRFPQPMVGVRMTSPRLLRLAYRAWPEEMEGLLVQCGPGWWKPAGGLWDSKWASDDDGDLINMSSCTPNLPGVCNSGVA